MFQDRSMATCRATHSLVYGWLYGCRAPLPPLTSCCAYPRYCTHGCTPGDSPLLFSTRSAGLIIDRGATIVQGRGWEGGGVWGWSWYAFICHPTQQRFFSSFFLHRFRSISNKTPWIYIDQWHFPRPGPPFRPVHVSWTLLHWNTTPTLCKNRPVP